MNQEAERVAAFLLARVQQRWGRLWDGGQRPDHAAKSARLPTGSALAVLASRRVRGITDIVGNGLIEWFHDGRPVDVIEAIPSAAEVLARQARGRRCVSLIPDELAASHGDPRHPDGLRFALHDIEHLEKFVTPEHHVGQVGFFRAVERSLSSPRFAAVQAGFDDVWRADRDYVIADMNGSAVFLFAVLKMKVFMAVRRQKDPRTTGADAGPLSAEEQARALPALEALIHGFGLSSEAEAAAFAVSARRDHPAAARTLLAGFESLADVPAMTSGSLRSTGQGCGFSACSNNPPAS